MECTRVRGIARGIGSGPAGIKVSVKVCAILVVHTYMRATGEHCSRLSVLVLLQRGFTLTLTLTLTLTHTYMRATGEHCSRLSELQRGFTLTLTLTLQPLVSLGVAATWVLQR